MADLFVDIKAAVVTAIKSLALGGFEQNVYAQIYPDLSYVKFPCVLVTSEGMAEQKQPNFESTEFRAYLYQLRIWIADRKSQQIHTSEPTFVNARGLIVDLFDEQQLSAVPRVRRIDVQFDVMFTPQVQEATYQYLHTNLQLNIVGLKDRGTGP